MYIIILISDKNGDNIFNKIILYFMGDVLTVLDNLSSLITFTNCVPVGNRCVHMKLLQKQWQIKNGKKNKPMANTHTYTHRPIYISFRH